MRFNIKLILEKASYVYLCHIMKAIIPVAGIGSRMKPHTQTQPKSLIPVAGKAILGHIIDSIIGAGINELVFIIGYQGDKIQEYVKANYPEYTSHFVMQTVGKGTAHAIKLTRDLIADTEPILIVLGDSITEAPLAQVIVANVTAVGVKKVEYPRLFGVAEINAEGEVKKLIEKPAIPKSNLALVGLYYIREAGKLMRSIDNIIAADIKTQNEYHLTDALQNMLDCGEDISTFAVESWFDCGKKEIILQTNENLLRNDENHRVPEHIYASNNIVVRPVNIAQSAQIKNSIIGPNVSIGEETEISDSIIRNSIIAANSRLENIILENSLLGNDSILIGARHSLNIGDNAEINFNA